jgi:threonine dehydrogenase-like Zn-dependent dehydrogenase
MSDDTIRILRIHAAGDLRLDEAAAPTPAPGEAVVRIAYGGVCGSDIHYWHDGAVGAFVLRAPMILGHEVVGTVEIPAADGNGPAAGQLVAIHPAISCGVCARCREGQHQLCRESRYLGSAAQWPHTDGGFAERIAVPAARLIPAPSGLAARRAALVEPTGIAWHAVSRLHSVGTALDGAHVLVVGAGPIGLLVAAVAIFRGAGRTTAVDIHERPLQVARDIGVDEALDARALSEAGPGLDADIAFESSGTVAGMATALRSVRRGGTVVAVGMLPSGPLPIPAGLITTNELVVTGSLRLDSELPAALEFLADPRALVDPIITDVFPLGQAAEAFATAADAARSSKVLLDFSR